MDYTRFDFFSLLNGVSFRNLFTSSGRTQPTRRMCTCNPEVGAAKREQTFYIRRITMFILNCDTFRTQFLRSTWSCGKRKAMSSTLLLLIIDTGSVPHAQTLSTLFPPLPTPYFVCILFRIIIKNFRAMRERAPESPEPNECHHTTHIRNTFGRWAAQEIANAGADGHMRAQIMDADNP